MSEYGNLYRATCFAYQNIAECPYRKKQTVCAECNQNKWKFVKSCEILEKEEEIVSFKEKQENPEQNVTSTD